MLSLHQVLALLLHRGFLHRVATSSWSSFLFAFSWWTNIMDKKILHTSVNKYHHLIIWSHLAVAWLALLQAALVRLQSASGTLPESRRASRDKQSSNISASWGGLYQAADQNVRNSGTKCQKWERKQSFCFRAFGKLAIHVHDIPYFLPSQTNF